MKLNALKFGVAGGILWGLSILVIALVNLYVFPGYAGLFLSVLASGYPGFEPTLWGSFIGLIYGFFDAFIGLTLFAWIYNRLI